MVGTTHEVAAPIAVERNVPFYSGPGYKLAADIYRPEDGTNLPAVAILHGWTGIKEFIVGAVAERFAAAGFLAMTFDYRGYGESEGPRHRLIPWEQVEDSRNALTYLETRDDVDATRLGIVGVSYGGAIALALGAVDARPRCISVNGCISDGERWMRSIRREWEWLDFKERISADAAKTALTGESERVSPWDILIKVPDPTNYIDSNEQNVPGFTSTLPLETARAVIEFKPLETVERIQAPMRFIHADNDPLVPTEQSVDAYARCRDPKSLIIVPVPARMDLYQKHFDVMVDHHLDWHEQYVRPENGLLEIRRP